MIPIRALALVGLAIVLLALPSSVAAQTVPLPGPLVDEVLNLHPAVRKATLRVAAAEANVSGAGLQPNPTLTLAATAGDAGENSNNLTQTFEISGQPRIRKEQAEAELESAKLQLRATRRAVAGEVMTGWLEVWKTEHLARIARLRLHLMREMLRVANRRYEVGEIPQNEALRVELAQAEADAAWRRAEAEYRSASRSLSVLRGLLEEAARIPEVPGDAGDGEVPTSLVATLEGPALAPPGEPWTLEQVVAAAETHPEVAALRQEQRATLLGAELIRKERAPQLGVSLYQSQFFGTDIERGAQVFISLPIFDWGSISARQKARELEAQAQMAEADEKVLGLRRKVADVWSRWQAARAVREILQAQAERYEELARESRIGYDVGMLTLTDVLQTEASFRQAGVELIEAQAEIYELELELLEQTNLPWPQDLLEEQ
jgi:outer membrane protein TolC